MTEHWLGFPSLVGEDLGEELVVELVELTEGVLDGGAVVAADQVQELAEAEGGVVQEHLGVLQAIAVASEVEVDEGNEVVDLPEGHCGMVGVVGGELGSGLCGQIMNQLGIEEALLAWFGMGGAQFELGEGLGSGDGFVCGGAGGEGEGNEAQEGN